MYVRRVYEKTHEETAALSKSLREQLDEANAARHASVQEMVALREDHRRTLEQLQVDHDAAMEAARREQRKLSTDSAVLQEKLVQAQAELAAEREAHTATKTQLKSRAVQTSDADRPRLQHRMALAAEMHSHQQSNYPNNPPSPTGTPVGTPRGRAPDEHEQQTQQHLQSRPEMKTIPSGRGAAGKIEMWKALERDGGTSPLPYAKEDTGQEEAEKAEEAGENTEAKGTPAKDGTRPSGSTSKLGTSALGWLYLTALHFAVVVDTCAHLFCSPNSSHASSVGQPWSREWPA